MEKLERKALQTAPAECRPKIWKRYVDDVLNVIKKDQVKNFTDHLNSIDDINSIKFTYEEETNGVIPFLDLLINRQPDKHHRSRHVPVCKILSKSAHPLQKKMTSCRFSRWRISAILDCRDPIMRSLKSPVKLT